MILKKQVAAIAFLLASVWGVAEPISVDAIHSAPGVTRDRQLQEVHQAFRPDVSAYVGFGIHYLPLSTQLPLKSPFGVHDGFAFRQHLELFFVAPAFKEKGIDLGALWFIERHGWDSKDFLFFPAYEKFSFVRSIQTGGLAISYPKYRLGVAAGVQYHNVERTAFIYPDESDSLYYWGHAYFGKTAIQASFHKADWRHIRLSLDLESKQLLGGDSTGLKTYFPNFDVTLFNGVERDSVKVSWEQNLYKQMLYSNVSFLLPDRGFYAAALKLYPSPSRLFALEATMLRKEGGGFIFGGGIEVPFVRLAYNSATDVENFFGSHGTFMVEIRFAISSIRNQFFALNAAKGIPADYEPLKTSAPNQQKGTSK